MERLKSKKLLRLKRKIRVRKKVFGGKEKPRLNVYRSLKHIYAQVIDDEEGKVITSASTLCKELKGKLNSTRNMEAAREVGKLIGKKCIGKEISKIVFDRNGYLYHGRIKALADAAREAGLNY